MSVNLVIKNGLVVGSQGVFRGGVAVDEGVIVAMGDDRHLPEASETVDAQGKVIFPGAIDPHTHFGVGGSADEEKFTSDFVTEPKAAATGGMTSFVTNHEHASGPSFITLSKTGTYNGKEMTLLDKAKAIAEERSVLDFRFTGLPQNKAHLDEMPAMIEQGVTSWKFYPSYQGDEAADFGLERLDWDFLYDGFERLAKLRTDDLVPLAMVHCEEPFICAMIKDRLKAEGREGMDAWADSRPAIAEAMQIWDVGMIAKDTGARAYVVHTSSKIGTDTIAHLKSLGVDMVGETCTHYLMLTKHSGLDRWAKVNPPIREQEDQDALWEALVSGTHEIVGSDDCGRYTREEKLSKDFWEAIPGFSEMAATLTLLVSEGVNKGRLTWEQLAKVASENAARRYSMYPRKGTLQVGSDGDIVLIDPEEQWTIDGEKLNYSADFCIYEGREVTGRPVMTWVRGQLVADHGKIVAEDGHGRYVNTGAAAEVE